MGTGGGGNGRTGAIRRALLPGALLVVLGSLIWLTLTDDVRVWPLRNTLEYRLWRGWAGLSARLTAVLPAAVQGERPPGPPGRVRGTVRDPQGRPLEGARVLVTLPDGTAFDAGSGAGGAYVIEGVPAGDYLPVAGAPGYADAQLGSPWLPWTRVRVPSGGEARADVRLVPQAGSGGGAGGPGSEGGVVLGPAAPVSCDRPLRSRAWRAPATLGWGRAAGARAGAEAILYTPQEVAPEGQGPRWPLLLTVYPGPAAEWECASLPLAEAGYAVLATGPAYSFEPERDVEDLARWLHQARAGALPGVDGSRAALLGGSYSGLHVQRLLRRPADLQGVQAVVLLGAPSDLFDARRRLEDGTYVPPFGLDAALVALGFPHREPLRYWRYSGAYHVRRDQPPLALIHSRRDEVVPFQQSEALARRLAAVGAPYRLDVFEAASHYLLSEDGDALAIYRLTLEFVGLQLTP
jgi:hypothetical protein